MSKITIQAEVNAAGFRTGLAQMRSNLNSFGASFKNIFALGGITAGAIAAVDAIKNVVSGLKGIFDEFDHIGDLSKTTGLGVGFLQDLGANAELTGSSLEELSKGYAKFNKELRMGNSKEFANALEDIGLQADNLKKMTPENVIKKVADSLSKLSDASQRQAIAMQLFGKSGSNLVPVLDQIAKEFVKVEKLSGSEVRNIQEMEDSWDALGRTIKQTTAKVVTFFTASNRKSQFQDKLSEAMKAKGVSEEAADRISGQIQPGEQAKIHARDAKEVNEKLFQQKLDQAMRLAKTEDNLKEESLKKEAAEAKKIEDEKLSKEKKTTFSDRDQARFNREQKLEEGIIEQKNKQTEDSLTLEEKIDMIHRQRRRLLADQNDLTKSKEERLTAVLKVEELTTEQLKLQKQAMEEKVKLEKEAVDVAEQVAKDKADVNAAGLNFSVDDLQKSGHGGRTGTGGTAGKELDVLKKSEQHLADINKKISNLDTATSFK